ncbi:hypothetical protein Lser_V15G36855 [Lactuca serriola]
MVSFMVSLPPMKTQWWWMSMIYFNMLIDLHRLTYLCATMSLLCSSIRPLLRLPFMVTIRRIRQFPVVSLSVHSYFCYPHLLSAFKSPVCNR